MILKLLLLIVVVSCNSTPKLDVFLVELKKHADVLCNCETEECQISQKMKMEKSFFLAIVANITEEQVVAKYGKPVVRIIQRLQQCSERQLPKDTRPPTAEQRREFFDFYKNFVHEVCACTSQECEFQASQKASTNRVSLLNGADDPWVLAKKYGEEVMRLFEQLTKCRDRIPTPDGGTSLD